MWNEWGFLLRTLINGLFAISVNCPEMKTFSYSFRGILSKHKCAEQPGEETPLAWPFGIAPTAFPWGSLGTRVGGWLQLRTTNKSKCEPGADPLLMGWFDDAGNGIGESKLLGDAS